MTAKSSNSVSEKMYCLNEIKRTHNNLQHASIHSAHINQLEICIFSSITESSIGFQYSTCAAFCVMMHPSHVIILLEPNEVRTNGQHKPTNITAMSFTGYLYARAQQVNANIALTTWCFNLSRTKTCSHFCTQLNRKTIWRCSQENFQCMLSN